MTTDDKTKTRRAKCLLLAGSGLGTFLGAEIAARAWWKNYASQEQEKLSALYGAKDAEVVNAGAPAGNR